MRASAPLLSLLWLTACGSKPPAAPPAQPDSAANRANQEALSKSGIPGAGGIKRALNIADTAAARTQRLDSISP